MSDPGLTVAVVFGGLISIIVVILGLPYLASIGLLGAQDSANLTSTGAAYSEALPWFGIIIGGGITLLAIDSARGRR